jgi:SpoIID/LytB domain protein
MRLQHHNPTHAVSDASRYPLVRRLAVVLAVLGLFGTAQVALPAAPVTAATSVVLDGHGYGHGFGLSQWGAYGYAVDYGWTSAQIVDHYYGNTVAGTIPLDTIATVRLLSLDNRYTTVVSATGGLVVDSIAGGPWKSVWAKWNGSTYDVYARDDAETCSTDPAGWTLAGSIAGYVAIRTQVDSSTTTNYSDLAGVCYPDGSVRSYRGAIVATAAGTRTVNHVPMEQYLRSVIAKEMSAGWATAGGGRGAQALQAQAIAARSYAQAENRYPNVSKTCDTTACQVYAGAASRSAIGTNKANNAFSTVEYPATDAAVLATAGVVRRVGDANGAVAYTMFAASSGGYTAPGNPFPAVVDDGDATALNPNHNWSVTLTGAQISAAYPAIGTFSALTVLTRNGYGDWGGRVLTLKLQGTAASVTVTGDAFKSKLGLKSNWFTVRGSAAPSVCSGRNAPAVGPTPPPAAPAGYTATDPVRLIDTRFGTGTAKERLAGGCTMVVDPGLPASATAVVVNLTAVFPATDGFVTAYPCGVERPTVSAIQALAGRVVAGSTVVPLGADGTFCVYSHATTDLVVDLFGSYAPDAGDRFEPVVPVPLFDSRSGPRLAPGTTVRIPVVTDGRAPAGATAAAFTIQAVSAAGGGFATVYPCAAQLPLVSSINVMDASGVTNHAEVALSVDGEVCVYVSTSMHIVVDLSGWYGAGATTRFYAVTPVRVLDTRYGTGLSGALYGGVDRALTIAGTMGLPDATVAKAFVAEVTAVTPTASGWITVHPCLPTVPSLSMARYATPWNSATSVVGIDDATGRWCFAASSPVHVLADVSGYFA